MHLRSIVAVIARLVLAFAVSAPALAQERLVTEATRDGTALCERLATKAHALRAAIARIEAVQDRIEQKLASGGLRPRQEPRARLALRLLEARRDALEKLLARVVQAYEHHCE